MDSIIVAQKPGVREAVTALIAGPGQILPDGLPGDRPIISGLLVPEVDVVSRPVQRNAVLSKAGNTVVLCALMKGISTGIVGDHCAEVFDSEIVRPGDGDIRPFDDILSTFVVKISIPHRRVLW